MRAKWPILFRVQWMGLTGLNKARRSGDAREKRRAAGGIVAVVLVGAMFVFYAAMLAVAFCRQGLGSLLPALTVALSSVIIFAFTLLRGSSMLFAVQDYDIVMSLPVSRRDIVTARLLCSYLLNLLFALVIAVPVMIVYFAMEGFSFGVLGTIALAVAAAPLLPLAAAVAVGTAVSALTARLRYKNLLQTLLGVAVFVAVMVASFSFSFSAEPGAGADMNALYRMLVGKIYPPALLVGMTLAEGAAWGVFAFAGISLAAAAVLVWVVAAFYTKISTALLSRAAGTAYRAKDVRAGSAFRALVRREFKRLFSSSGVLLNGVTGALLLLLAAVALLFVDLHTLFEIPPEGTGVLGDAVAYMGAGILIMLAGMSSPAASALSLEGRARGILFSMPVSARQILLAKAVPTVIIDATAGLAFAAVLCAKIGAGAPGWAVLLATALLFPLLVGLGGCFLNFKFPKYDWTVETQAVKNSIPVLIAVFGALVLGTAALILAFFIGPWAAIAVDALSLALSAAIVVYFGRVRLYSD